MAGFGARASLARNLGRRGLSTRHPTWETLEQLFTEPWGFGIATATAVQRAVLRTLEGRPLGDLATDPDVLEALGGVVPSNDAPTEMILLAGIRSGKSLIAAAAAVHASQRCQVDHLAAGEIPRVSIVSLTQDLSSVVLQHLRGAILGSPLLSRLLVRQTADTIVLRHPSGRPVEIKVVAGSKAAGALVARWSAGLILDEASRMSGSEDAVVSFDDARAAMVGRLLPGAQMISISSPWGPSGPFYDLFTESHGNPTSRIVSMRARGPAMNPVWWTPERCCELQANDPESYATDVDCRWRTADESFLSADQVDRCTRADALDVPPDPRNTYVAAMDPATRSNAWTLIIMTRDGKQRTVCVAREWVPKAGPLSPSEVLADIAVICRSYGVTTVQSDGWSLDALRDLARQHGLSLFCPSSGNQDRTDRYLALRRDIQEGLISIPAEAQLRQDLLGLRRRVTQNGVTIHLPQTSDGRHCDYAPSMALAHSAYIPDSVRPRTQADVDKAELDAVMASMRGQRKIRGYRFR